MRRGRTAVKHRGVRETDGLPRSGCYAAAMVEPDRRERRRAKQRELIYATALELFVERGFEDVTVNDIVRAADVAKGTFFNYFPTKEHLLLEYRRSLLDDLHEFGESLEGESARELFKKYFRRLARRIRSEGERYEMLLKEVLARPHLVALDGSRQGRHRGYFQRWLELGVDAGEISEQTDLELLAETLRDLWGGTSTHWSMEGSRTSLEARMLRRVDFLFDLLAAGADA